MTVPVPISVSPSPAVPWIERLKSQNWKVILALVLVTALACAPIYYHRIAVPVDTDYGTHVKVTQQLLAGEPINPLNLSHPMIQLILAGMHLATAKKLGLYASLMIVQVLVQVLTALLLYAWFGSADRKHWDWLRAGAAVSLTFVAPIMLLAFQDGLFYYGYIGMANYHNPTIHLLKPVALLSLIFAIRAAGGERSGWRDVGLAALWITLSTWIKPNYALAILPALALVGFVRWLQRRQVDLRMLVFGFALPAVVMLFIQWLIAYYYGDPGEAIILAPFVVEGSYSGNLALKFLLSSLFPLLVLFIARRKLLDDSSLLVGWAGFLAGAAQFYLLAEGGQRMFDGNFRWSGQIMLFLLFAVTVRWLLREKILAGGIRLWEKISSYGVYLAHLGGGAAYYIYCMLSIHYR
jgi:hypothetical protein